MPIGEEIKGRFFNVVGDAIDGIGLTEMKEVLLFTETRQNLRTYLLQLKSFYRY